MAPWPGRGVAALAVALLAGPWAGTAHAQITTSTALPVHEGQWILRGQVQHLRSTGDPTAAARELSVTSLPTVAVYGVTEKLAAFAILPYLDKELDATTPLGRVTRENSGFGDATFLARYTAIQWDAPGETRRLAPFAGLKVPTGEDDASDALGRLPQPLQLGSGSWDPIAGGVFTWQTLDWQLDTSASYQLTTRASGRELGDTARLDVSVKRRVLPRSLEGAQGVPGFLYGVLESNLVWQDRDELGGAVERDSGGTTWHLAPGLQYVTQRVVLEAAVQLPVVQDLRGDGLENDFIATAGFRISF